MVRASKTVFLNGGALAGLLALSACGGGGGGGTSVTPPTPQRTLALSGTAATGAAMASAAVQAKCAGGTGSATTAADGSFALTLSGASLPCVLSATSGDGKTTLRSVAESGSAASAVANITPLSEVVAAVLAQGDAATLFTSFDSATQAKLTPAAVASALGALGTALKGTIDLTGVDPIKGALVAASAGKPGDELDKKLDALAAAFGQGGTTVADLAAALVANPGAPAVAARVFAPPSSSCPGLRSGGYQLLNPYNPASPVTRIEIDAKKMTGTSAAGGVVQWLPDGPCAFVRQDGAARLYASSAGIGVLRYAESATVSRLALMVPDQSVPIAELAGTWNIALAAAESPGAPLQAYYAVETMDSSSQVTAGADCVGLAACTSWTPRASDKFTANPAGGFDTADETESARVFAVKTVGGQIALFGVLFDAAKRPQALAIFSRQASLAAPVLGQVGTFWDLQTSSAGAKPAAEVRTTISTVDADAKRFSWTRSADGHSNSFAWDVPRKGMIHRPAGTSTNAAGATISYPALLSTPLPGMGMTVYSGLGSEDFFGVTVARP